MDLIQLNYFVTTIEEGSLTRAAEKLYITQPALSRSLSRLTEELEVPLFLSHSRGRKIVASPGGEKLYSWAKTVLKEYADLKKTLRKNLNDENRTLVVAISGVQIGDVLLEAFQQENPLVRVNTVLFKSSEFPDIIFRPDVDFLISSQPCSQPQTEDLLLTEEPLLLILSKDHPLAEREELRLADLKEESFIFPPADNLHRRTLDRIFRLAGFEPRIQASVQTRLRMSLVRSGAGVTLWPKSSADTLLDHETLTARPLKDAYCRRNIFLSYRLDLPHSELFRSFLRFTGSFFPDSEADLQNPADPFTSIEIP